MSGDDDGVGPVNPGAATIDGILDECVRLVRELRDLEEETREIARRWGIEVVVPAGDRDLAEVVDAQRGLDVATLVGEADALDALAAAADEFTESRVAVTAEVAEAWTDAAGDGAVAELRAAGVEARDEASHLRVDATNCRECAETVLTAVRGKLAGIEAALVVDGVPLRVVVEGASGNPWGLPSELGGFPSRGRIAELVRVVHGVRPVIRRLCDHCDQAVEAAYALLAGTLPAEAPPAREDVPSPASGSPPAPAPGNVPGPEPGAPTRMPPAGTPVGADPRPTPAGADPRPTPAGVDPATHAAAARGDVRRMDAVPPDGAVPAVPAVPAARSGVGGVHPAGWGPVAATSPAPWADAAGGLVAAGAGVLDGLRDLGEAVGSALAEGVGAFTDGFARGLADGERDPDEAGSGREPEDAGGEVDADPGRGADAAGAAAADCGERSGASRGGAPPGSIHPAGDGDPPVPVDSPLVETREPQSPKASGHVPGSTGEPVPEVAPGTEPEPVPTTARPPTGGDAPELFLEDA